MITKTLHPPQIALRKWLDARGIKIGWAAGKCRYTPQYFSRVLGGKDPLTEEFIHRCKKTLGALDEHFIT